MEVRRIQISPRWLDEFVEIFLSNIFIWVRMISKYIFLKIDFDIQKLNQGLWLKIKKR